MAHERLTPRQQQVVWLRYANNASIDQIAQWLRISRRAVFCRLRNARERGFTHESAALEMEIPANCKKIRRRLYNASQLSGAPGQETLTLDNV